MNNLEKFLTEYEKIAVPDDQIDTSDCPELTKEQLKSARRLHPRKPKDTNVVPFIIKIDNSLASHLYESSNDWESKVNEVLMNAYAAGQI